MSVKHAMNLIQDAKKNFALRTKLNGLSQNELKPYLYKTGYVFTPEDFDMAADHLHMQCQTYNQADEHLQLVMWLRLLLE
ncbi:MAG: hypothetical protein GVY19_13310 [Bacteroidetes bacterium]|jgi:hypothetical protein|nr:hypothetical protein [Bacteroidota bacterium]